jgi:replicative DNA helicase
MAAATDRTLASESGVDSVRLMLGHQSEREEKKIMQALGTLADLPVYFDDSAMLTVSEMRGKAKRLQQERGALDLVVVDYLQLMNSGMRNENRVQEVSHISRGLKQLARDLDVP